MSGGSKRSTARTRSKRKSGQSVLSLSHSARPKPHSRRSPTIRTPTSEAELMAEYFTSRGLPVPRELERNPLTDWRRLSVIAGAILVFYIGLRITNPDFSRANPEYAADVFAQLFHWDLRILTPQNEFETFWGTA